MIHVRANFKQGDVMKIAELVEALESVRSITGECEVIVSVAGSDDATVSEVEVSGKPGALKCAIKVIPLVK